jgi:carboxyl-terminal processing protease
MDEAIQLSGLFIDAGPVGQVVSRDAKVYTLKDVNRGTVWSGPLLVLVNGSSASASEMVAGTLQDYNRALIVGSPTYGKATAQVVFPMDTTIDLEHFNPQMKASSYLKLTISKLYRVNGSTAQTSGVKPDVTLPDPPGSETQREADEKFVLPPTPIPANKYYLPLAPLPVAEERAIAEKAIGGMPFFKTAQQVSPEKKAIRDQSLNLDELIATLKTARTPDDKDEEEKNDLYTIGTPAYERPADDERKKDVLYDPYLQVAYQLIAGMIK